MKRGAAADRKNAVAAPTEAPDMVPVPPILPLNREWRQAVLEATGDLGEKDPAMMKMAAAVAPERE
jgi:hypothetical protein